MNHPLEELISESFIPQGNIGSTNWGINLLMEEDIIPEIVRMTEECENFAIRG